MKRFFRSIAAVLAIALVVALVPARVSSAATNKPRLAYASKTLFAGGSTVRKAAKSEFVLKVKNKPKKYSCTWSVSDPDVVNIEALKSGKCSVKAVSVGTAVVRCDLTDKKEGSKYVLETKIYVKKNTSDVKISYTGSLDALRTGGTLKLEGSLIDKDGRELVSIQPGDVTKTANTYVSDIIRWSSNNTNVATVSDNGLVTAKKTGTAVITCYAVQAPSGAYNKLTKATARQTINITVKEEIVSIKQTTLNKFQVVFGRDMRDLVTKDNLVVTNKTTGVNTPVASVSFSEDGKTVFATMTGSLPDATTYIVSFSDMKKEFVASKGAVAAISLYTNTNNVAVLGENTQILFRLIDANGVDITPLDTTSNEYYTYRNKIAFSLDNTGAFTLSGDYIYFQAINTSALVRATYRENPTATPIVGTASLAGVSEASLLQIDGVTVISGSKVGKNIDFTRPATVSKSDSGYSLVVRAKNAKGEYIYSNAADSKFTFEAANNTNTTCFIDGNGLITPLNIGSAEIKIKYDNVLLKTEMLTVLDERKVASFKFVSDGSEVSGGLMLSSVPGVDTADVVITAYDQYGDKFKLSTADQLNIYALGSVSPYITKAINLDGSVTATIAGAGFGSAGGRPFAIQVAYGNTAVGSFTVVIHEPSWNTASTYKLVVSGDKDLAIPTANGGLPKLTLNLYEQKNGINVNKIVNIYPLGYTIGTDQYWYEISAPSGYSTYPQASMHVDYFDPYELDTKTNTIKKFQSGILNVSVYQKTSTSQKKLIASQPVVIKDSTVAPTFESIRSTTSSYSITSGMSEPAARSVVLDCLKITWYNESTDTYDLLGTDNIEIVLVNGKVQSSSKNLYVGNILCKRTVTVGGTVYTVPYTLTIGRTFTSTY